ncbi:MAG: flagellar export chaperone FliS [Peptococcaceae bacterium]|jgi:flagellar protein FliS|nr:flagellar export chaperone FliS [Peptococcaceae bacterium]
MVSTQAVNIYKNQQVMLSVPEQLTLMLYNGALRFLNESVQALEREEIEKSHLANLRVQDIIKEFVRTLDMSIELSHQWAKLYEYTEYCLIQGNIKKDAQKLYEARDILQEMRDTWELAIKKKLAETPLDPDQPILGVK